MPSFGGTAAVGVLVGGTLAGVGAAAGIQAIAPPPAGERERVHGSSLLQTTGGVGLWFAGVVGAIAFEQTVGPYATRFHVDAAERVSARLLDLNWSSKSVQIGAAAAAFGLGLTAMGMAGIEVRATGDGGPADLLRTSAGAAVGAVAGIGITLAGSALMRQVGFGQFPGGRLFTLGMPMMWGLLAASVGALAVTGLTSTGKGPQAPA